MKLTNYIFKFLFLLFVSFTLFVIQADGQYTSVKGVVTDKATGEPLPLVNIMIVGENTGATTDFSGQYNLQSMDAFTKIKFSYLGYKDQIVSVTPGKSQVVNIQLVKEAKELKEVTIKPAKKRYKNKDNPAVDLIREVIDHKKSNRSETLNAFETEEYEKIQFSLSNISEKFRNRKYLKKFQFIFENVDTIKSTGKQILPIYVKETLSDNYYRKSPKEKKEVIKATKHVTFDDYLNNDGINTFMKYLYQDINIYDNSVMLLTNPFMSPIADAAPLFYKYFILDTLMIDSVKCVHVSFFPRNKTDMLLQGDLYITLDSNYAVRRDLMGVSPDINLNFVKELSIEQDYNQIIKGEWLLTRDELIVDFGLAESGLGVYGKRSVSYKNYVLNKERGDQFYKGDATIMSDSAETRSDEYWNASRHSKLTRSEQGVYTMIDSVQKIPAFRRTMNLLVLVLAGYRDFGLFEIGPVNTFYSYNPIEGLRIRVGGRTTPKLSEHFNFETYATYGFLDDRWKYYLGTTFALGRNPYNKWPLNNLKISYQKETKIPGQELQFVQEDNLLLSIKRGTNDKLMYNNIFSAEYLREYKNHFSFGVGFKNLIQEPGGTLVFNPVDYYGAPEYDDSSTTTTEVSLNLRYAPNEQFYQGKNFRTPMYNRSPIFHLQYIRGFDNVLKGEYSYDNIRIGVFKRFFTSPIGYTDVFLEGGKIFGQVPYPLLDIHRANLTFSYQLQSYNMMNYLEFVSDEFIALNFDHFFNGFFLNKVPLFKRLKLREVVTAKFIYGTISDKNDPDKNPSLYRFPTDPTGKPLTYSLEAKPYVEASVGVTNILKLFSIYLVRRFTYLDHPSVGEYGILGRFKFDI